MFSSEASKSAYKTTNITNITDKLRAENKLFSQDNRLKVRLIYESLKLLLVFFTRCTYNIYGVFKNSLDSLFVMPTSAQYTRFPQKVLILAFRPLNVS